jgi:glutamate racemase
MPVIAPLSTKGSLPVANAPIRVGVFDSGVGGLTVLQELMNALPQVEYFYFGDTARLPYGSKSAETVIRHSISSVRFLEERGIQLLVIACNTATALALDAITKAVKIPVIGVVEPGAAQAAALSRTKKVVVIATEATVSSHAYQRALAQRGIAAQEKACPLLVPLVEEGWTDHSVTEQTAQIYLSEAFKGSGNGADVLVLGCTHYPLLKPLLRRITPKGVSIVDSAESTAHAVTAQLQSNHDAVAQLHAATATRSKAPTLHFFATDSVDKFRKLGERFLGHSIAGVTLVDVDG